MDPSIKKELARRKAARRLGLSPNALDPKRHKPKVAAKKKHKKKRHPKKHSANERTIRAVQAAHKRLSAKAHFIKSQMSKGRSEAQAKAAYKLAHHKR
jgi:hypothetical protein